MYGGIAEILSQENPIFRRENPNLADFTAGIQKIQVKSGGVVVAGELSPPPQIYQIASGVCKPSSVLDDHLSRP